MQRLGHEVVIHAVETGPMADLAVARGVSISGAEESLPAREERREGSFFKGTPPRKRAAPVKKGASRSHGNFTDQALVDLYLQGKSVQEIAKGLGAPRDVVLQRMQTLGMF